MEARTIFYCVISILLLVAVLISIIVITRICLYDRPKFSNISMLLVFNTYVTISVCDLTLLEEYVTLIYDSTNPSIKLDNLWCLVRFYLISGSLTSMYYSFVIQALFRFFRIVFYQKMILQSWKIWVPIIASQWFLAYTVALLYLLLHHIEYLPNERFCQVAFTDVVGFFIMVIDSYLISITSIFILYGYLIRYTHRRTAHLHQQRQRANKRDIVVLRRLVILVLALIAIAVPTFIVVLIGWITRYWTPYSYQLEGLSVTLGLIMETIVLSFVTPQIRLVFQRTKIRPTAVIPHMMAPTVRTIAEHRS